MKFQLFIKTKIPKPIEINILFEKITSIFNKKIKTNKKNFFDVNIVGEEEMKQINLKYRHIDKPTDVLSFAFHDKEPKTNLLGEIFINWNDVVVRAKMNGCSESIEAATLFIHGVLHLLGFDHNNEYNEEKMFSLQKEILNNLNLK